MEKLYKDSSREPSARAEKLLKELSLDEKIAQVCGMWGMPQIPEEEKEAYQKLYEHGVGHVSTLFVRDLKSLTEAADFQRQLQKEIMDSSEHHIPAIFHMEGLCGGFITGSLSIPSGIGRGSSFDPELEEKLGKAVARQELSCGISQVLAPVLDVTRDPRMGRQGESYGEDPTVVAAMGSAYAKGIQEAEAGGRHADACAKHFLGFHNSQGGIHGANVDMGDRLTQEIFGKPFQAAIVNSSLRGVMPSYNSVAGEPVSASKKYLTELLRKEMGFDGCVISDYGAVGNIHRVQGVEETEEAGGLRALKAGMDAELPDGEVFRTPEFRNLFDPKKNEHADENLKYLDRAVLHILTAKFRMGLFEHPFALSGEDLRKSFFSPEDRALSLQSAKESLVLLKNDGVLPLDTASGKIHSIAVIGPHADNARSFFGGYTHQSMEEGAHAAANATAGVGKSGSLGGSGYLHVPGTDIQSDETKEFDDILKWVKPDCPSIVEQLRKDLPDVRILTSHGYYIAGDDESGFDEALQTAAGADIIILTLGGKHGTSSVASMGEGVDASDINLPKAQDDFIREVSKLGKPVIGIHFNGRPISSDVADQYLDAILEAWNPSETGAQAISEVLRGISDPSGRMPLTTARCAGQVPIYYNHPNGSAWHQGDSIGFQNYVDLPHTPRYYFGEGMSYTTFSYSDLELSCHEADPEDPVKISCVLKNTGMRTGTEVVQLYFKDMYASMTRPVMELAGFARVTLEPGQSRRVSFTMYPSQTAFLDQDMRWKTEEGEIKVMIGSSSNDIRLEDSFRITASKYIRGRDRRFWAESEK